jgi:Domain of unknown function (DUF4129)
MAASRESPKLADYVVPAISPALIMGLVGSLVFFLAEIFYAGKYEGRLLHTLFFFVFGIVLVARIAVVVDRTRSALYGAVLTVVAWIALQAYVDYPKDSPMAPYSPLINAVLLAVVWWCSTKLAWDCTFIDERRESSSRGLLAATGFEQRPADLNRGSHVVADPEPEKDDKELSIWERWRRYRQAKAKKPHTPGVTIIYFSLAALPIFGLGQSLIPADEGDRRRFTFWLAAVYVGCALGLLLTTSFLGLRRYLRQRKLQMPLAMTSVWLGMGALLVGAFVLVGAILPRPYSETPILGMDRLVSSDRKASKNAVMRDGAGKGEGRPGEQTTKGDGQATAKGGEPGGKGKSGDAKEGSGSEQGKQGGSGKSKEGKDGSGKGKEASDSKSQKENPESGGRSSADQPKDGSNEPDSLQRFQNSGIGKVAETIGALLKWIAFILLALLVLAMVFRGGLQYLANFMPWAKRWLEALSAWWRRLFGRRASAGEVETGPAEERKPARVPFSAFSNPFSDGSAGQRASAELVAYSFAALEAWAGDRDEARRQDETPLEFAARLQARFPSLEPETQNLAVLVARMSYAGGKLPESTPRVLEAFWDIITDAYVGAAHESEMAP